ncbi:MAG: hypothetical protein PVI21_01645 [Candidatus Woesebacteria bacterium]|jgi:hypothetical protein
MRVLDLYNSLKDSHELNATLDSLATYVASRNLFPMTLMQFYSGKRIEGDTLTEYYYSAIELVQQWVDKTNLEDESGIDGDEFESLKVALWFCKDKDSGVVHPATFAKWLVTILLEDHTPSIDRYIESLSNTGLLDDLELDYDENLLVKISGSPFELKKHGLILAKDKMIYPHQFMRRYFRANFVNLLVILSKCIEDGLDVKVRIDPLRHSTHPRYYQNIFEADHWYGKPFDKSTLESKNKKELVTVHRSDDKFDMTYPVSFTVFRTSMMDANLRQFTIEEYAPASDPTFPAKKSPGFGQKSCIQKFAHFVYDQKAANFCHIDGAVRTFSTTEYEGILDSVVRSNDPGSKIGTRHKLFLVEGAIDFGLIQGLLYEYFRYNPHIEEYFSGRPSAND